MNAMNRFAGIATLMLAATGCGGPELEETPELETQAQVQEQAEPGSEQDAEVTASGVIGDYNTVTLQVKQSGLCLDVGKDPYVKGAPLRQYPCHNGVNQLFRFVPAGDDHYSLVNVASGYCLDIKDASDASGARLQQYPCHNGQNQQFRFRADGGYYQMRVRDSGKCVEAKQTYPLPEARIQQESCHDGDPTQLFKIKLP